MADEKKVTDAAAPEGAAPQPAVPAVGDGLDFPGEGAGAGGVGAGDAPIQASVVGPDIQAPVAQPAADDDDDLIIQKPWYQRLWGCIAAVGRWLWKFWWLWLIALLVAAAVAYHFYAGNGEEKAPVDKPAAATTLTNPDSTAAMASATEERLGRVEETLKSAPAAIPGAASVVVVDQAQWISQCVSWGGSEVGCKKRLELLRVR